MLIKVCVTSKQKIVYAGPFFALPSLYINSVLLNLNIRKFIHFQRHEKGDVVIHSTFGPGSVILLDTIIAAESGGSQALSGDA
jgi:hypothetical protein